MTEGEIIAVLIQAAKTDRLLPDTASPKRLKAIDYGYIQEPSDDVPARTRLQASKNDVGLWLAAPQLVRLERRASYRRCLWAWAMSKAGRHQFKAWCKVEGIHVETGRRRAKDAVKAIASRFKCNDALHSENNAIEVLIAPPKTGYNDSKMPKSWMSDDACLARECAAYEWQGIREARNARRRMAAR